MVREWEGWLKDAMPKLEGPALDQLKGNNHIIVHDGKQYSTYQDTFHLMATKVWGDMQSYESKVGFKNDVSSRSLHRPIPNLS